MAVEPPPAAARPRLGGNVLALGAVSLLTDVSSEMIYPLLPGFLAGTLGASGKTIGAIEGAAETLASLLKLASGRWSDRLGRRKPLVVAGYALASAVRPLVAAAQSVSQVLAIRLLDRTGKGIRTAPRDALLADSVDPSVRGRTFGFHRAMDNAGAALGPLAAFALLRFGGLPLRTVFWLSAIPAALSLVVLVTAVRDAPRAAPAPPVPAPGAAPPARSLGRGFWGFLAVLLVFTLGNSTDAFLLLRAGDLGVAPALLPVLWAMFHVVKSASSTHGGALSDRLGRRPPIVAGWILYALVYAGFAVAGAPWHAWALFAAYGLYYGLTEGTEKALVADLVPAGARGTAFGWYNLTLGLAALPASLLFGAIWDAAGPAAAFGTGAGLALLAACGLGLLPGGRPGGPAV